MYGEEADRQAELLSKPAPLDGVFTTLDTAPVRLDPVLTIPEAARYLKVGETTVKNLLRAGTLTPVRIESSVRLERVELDRFIERHRVPRSAQQKYTAPADYRGLVGDSDYEAARAHAFAKRAYAKRWSKLAGSPHRDAPTG